MLMLTFVPCNQNDPATIAFAKEAKNLAYRAATTLDEYESVFESHWSEYMPPCECAKCWNEEQEMIREMESTML